MISNILVGLITGVICGLVGYVSGLYHAMNMIIKINRMFRDDTGKDFVAWVFKKSRDKQDKELEHLYAAE